METTMVVPPIHTWVLPLGIARSYPRSLVYDSLTRLRGDRVPVCVLRGDPNELRISLKPLDAYISRVFQGSKLLHGLPGWKNEGIAE